MINKILITTTLLFSIVNPTLPEETTSDLPTEIWDYANTIEDGAVYFIRSALYDTKVFDVPNSSYSNNTDIIFYSSNGWNNQRFVLNKEFLIDGKMTYSISPLESMDKVLSIPNESNLNNKKLQIKEKEDYSHIKSDKFYFIPSTTSNSFKIATASSDFTKYLTTQNYSVDNSTPIVQKTLDTSNELCYEWYLEKTDSLGVNVNNNVYINGTNNVHLNLRVPYSGSYSIKTSYLNASIDTYLTLMNEDSTITLASNDDGGGDRFSKITYNLQANTNYAVKVRGYNSSAVGNVYLSLYPEKMVYINTYVDPDDNTDIDTRADSIAPRNAMMNSGYYVDHVINADYSYMNSNDSSGKSRFNNEYYMISSHGYSMGNVTFSPTSIGNPSNFSDMSNTQLAVWAICHGGAEGNAADIAATEKNAANSLGWPGLTYPNTSKTFTDKLWDDVLSGVSVTTAVTNAMNHTSSTYWYKNIGGWGDDTILNPHLYTPSRLIVFVNAKSSNTSLSFDKMDSFKETTIDEFEQFKNNKEYIANKTFDNVTIFVQLINGLVSNNFYIFDNNTGKVYKKINIYNSSALDSSRKSESEIKLPGNAKIILENEMMVCIKGTFIKVKRIQYKISYENNECLYEKYYNMETGAEIPEREIVLSFNS